MIAEPEMVALLIVPPLITGLVSVLFVSVWASEVPTSELVGPSMVAAVPSPKFERAVDVLVRPARLPDFVRYSASASDVSVRAIDQLS